LGMGGIWFVSYFAGYENPNLPGIKSFTALPEGAIAIHTFTCPVLLASL
jgi:hypothetical protein